MTAQTTAEMRRCLLIVPVSFYSFHKTVSEGIQRRGYAVDVINDEFPANAFGKICGKLALPLLRRMTLKGLRTRLADKPAYDVVLIIKGRGIGPEAIAYLRTKAKKIIGYNFDSFRFNPSPLDWHAFVDRYATFDIRDAQAHGLPLVHLFSAAMPNVNREKRYDVSIIQRVHSDRLAFAELLLRSLGSRSAVFVFLYEQGLLTFLLGVARHPGLYVRLWRHISFTPMPYERAMQALGQSRVTLDYAHPQQSGVTVRCFEAQSLGVAVLTNNIDAVQSGLFPQSSIAHLSKDADPVAVVAAVDLLLRNAPAPGCRSLNDFLEDLFSDVAPLLPSENHIAGEVV